MSWVFDGSSTALKSTSITPPSNSAKGMAVVDMKPDGTGSYNLVSLTRSSDATPFMSLTTVTGAPAVTVRNAAGTAICVVFSSTAPLTANVRHKIVYGWDLSVPEVKIIVDGTVMTNTESVLSAGVGGYAQVDQMSLGAYLNTSGDPAGGYFDGTLYEAVFWPGVYLDLETAADSDEWPALKDLFYAQEAGVLTSVGYDVASQYLGGNPYILVDGALKINNGSGPDFTRVGTHTADIDSEGATQDPTDRDRRSAQGFFGETWGVCDLCGWFFPESQLVEQPGTGLTVCTTGPRDYDPEDDHRYLRGGVYF